MADDVESSGLGLIVGILIAAVVIFLAVSYGPGMFRGSSSPDVNVTINPPAPAAPKE